MSQSRSYRSGRPYGRNNQSRNSNASRYGSQSKSRKPKKEYIDPSRFINRAKPVEELVYDSTHKFSDFAVNDVIQKNLADMGYTTPSPIQDQTIPTSLKGRDIVGIANTGTGKTAAFAIPLVNHLMENPTSKALILAPTRELATQIEQQCRKIGKNSQLFGALLIGGTSMGNQLRDLRDNPRIIIGTPGRTKDHTERGSLNLADFDMVVLDEVDRMLDMGFVHDITELLAQTSPERQSFYFSATLDARVRGIIKGFSDNPFIVSIKSGVTSDSVDQDIVRYKSRDAKVDKLQEILNLDATVKTIIFDDTQRSVDKLSKELLEKGYKTESIHGGKSQPKRQRALNRFKKGEVDILVATDVAARGLDVSDITHVINYSLPQSYAEYVHRVGRAGRAGKTGFALTFVES